MIKILHVIGKMDRAGAESMIMSYYRAIDRTKFQFDFLVQTEEEADYDKEIISYGGKIYRLPRYLIYNTWIYRQACKKFFELHHDYDIVHGHIGSCASIYLKEAKKYDIFTIAHSHSTGMVARPLMRFLFDIVTHSTRYIADYFFACSLPAGADRYGERIVKSEKFQVIHNAINSKQYIYTKEKHEKLKHNWKLDDKIVVGHVGRFRKEKNHEFLIQVFAEFIKIVPNAHLVLTGDGELEAKIKELVEKNGLTEHVTFTGGRNDVPDMMNLFDLFVFPSFYEGLGIVLIEAQAAGLPCIASDAIVDEAILTDNVKKMCLNQGAEQWALEMKKILCSFARKDETPRIIDAGYDIYANARQLEEFYESHSKRS